MHKAVHPLTGIMDKCVLQLKILYFSLDFPRLEG